MLHDFLNGVGNGLTLLVGLALLALLFLWLTLPFLVLQLVRSNRALTEEVRRLRSLHEGKERPSDGHIREEEPDGE